jgi:hypothetical protein
MAEKGTERAMRLPRMTTRRWMNAVAVVAVLLAATVLFSRHLRLRGRGDYHERMEGVHADRARGAGQFALGFTDSNPEMAAHWRAQAACEAEIGAWHAHLKEKYHRAARYPWLAIERDPPEPENPFILENVQNKDIPGLP